jgi:hypothetical protein
MCRLGLSLLSAVLGQRNSKFENFWLIFNDVDVRESLRRTRSKEDEEEEGTRRISKNRRRMASNTLCKVCYGGIHF